MDPSFDVVTIGHAIVDVLALSENDFPEAHGMEKGTMTLVEAEQADAIYRDLPPAIESSGGSAANTAVGVAALGGRAAFMGKVRDDAMGGIFAHDIRAAGVEFSGPAAASGPGTGRCLVMVTPDAQRTMATYLGAGAHLYPDDIDHNQLITAKIVYVEGYLCGIRETEWTVSKAAAAAHLRDGRFALSLSDPYWVDLHAASLGALLDQVDILFANEEEATGMTGEDLEGAIKELAHRCDLVAITRGAQGSVVATQGRVFDVPAHPVDAVVDTTGAGDMYAAGFLYGLTHDLDAETCARLGSLVAAEIIGHLGARPEASLTAMAAEAGLLR